MIFEQSLNVWRATCISQGHSKCKRPEVGLVGRLYRTRYQKGNQAWDLGSWDQEVVSLGPCKCDDVIVACSFCVTRGLNFYHISVPLLDQGLLTNRPIMA